MTVKELKKRRKYIIRYIKQFFSPWEQKYVDELILPYYLDALTRLYYESVYEESVEKIKN